jgi:superfamily II DNA or RNA helicase
MADEPRSVEVTVPPRYGTAASEDGNVAQQLLEPGQLGRLIWDTEGARIERTGKTAVPVVKSSRGLAADDVVLKLPRARFDDAGVAPAEADFRWTGPGAPTGPPEEIRASYASNFRFLLGSDEGDTPGLRVPQLGAVHAALAHWTTGSREPATVMMPTGTGKTDTMVALLVAAEIPRLLVLVPSDALRKQIASKFEALGILPQAGIVDGAAVRPVVGQIEHGFKSAEGAADFADACNVVVATPAALYASAPEIRRALLARFSHLFIDEAHHVEAETWQQLRDEFADRQVLQFTATPYREDGRKLGGRLIYAFPLREAQRRKYFSRIDYRSVIDFGDPDGELARRAVRQLRTDLDNGYDHVLMARFNRIGRARDLLPTYMEEARELNPVIVYSRLPKGEQKAALESLFARESRIVLCVDMLGEGFDLPSLKVAAIHDPHKSLGVTLQFVGRFARSSADTIGRASVFIGRPERDYDHRLRRLYAEDADWNEVISDLSERATQDEIEVDDFERHFANRPDDIPMRAVAPKMSTVVYRTSCADWDPDRVIDVYPADQLLTWPVPINLSERAMWFVVEIREETPWAGLPGLEEVEHHLFVAFWDRKSQLLYIHSSNKSSIHENLAKALAGADVKLIKGLQVYRAMSGLQRMVPTNVGLLDVRNRNRRFQMLVGANVREGFPSGEAQNKTQTNIFASGFENGRRVTVGASLKGRVWSYQRARSIKHWVDWCQHVGAKLADESVDIDEVMGAFIKPVELSERPDLVAIGVEWPIDVWLSTSEELTVSLAGERWPLLETDLRVTDFSRTGPIAFDVETPTWTASYTAAIRDEQVLFSPMGPEVTVERPRGAVSTLSAYLDQTGPLFLLEQEAVIAPPAVLLKPDDASPPFEIDRLTVLEWPGVDLKKESQGQNRDQDTIQARSLAELLTVRDWDVVIDDDGAGEVADLVAIKEDGGDLHVTLVHCKYSSEEKPGGRVEDLYDVCGQTQKSIRWKHYVDAMFARLIQRERRRLKRGRRSGFEIGTGNDLYGIRDRAYAMNPRFEIVIAQPGLSKQRVSSEQLRLLSATDVYVSEVAVANLHVWCSA